MRTYSPEQRLEPDHNFEDFLYGYDVTDFIQTNPAPDDECIDLGFIYEEEAELENLLRSEPL